MSKQEEDNNEQATQSKENDRSVEPIFSCEVAGRLPSGYAIDGNLIYQLVNATRRRAICGLIVVRKRARKPDGTGYCAEIAFEAMDKTVQVMVVDLREFINSPKSVAAKLMDRGFDLRANPREVLLLLQAMPTENIVDAVDVTGWVGDNYDCFVSPAGDILSAPTKSGSLVFNGRSLTSGTENGSLENWVDGVVGQASSDAAMIGLCAAITPLLLPVTGNPSFLLHLYRNELEARISQTVAASVWGMPGELQLSWTYPLSQLVSTVRSSRHCIVIISGYKKRHQNKLLAVLEAMDSMDAAGSGGMVVLSSGIESLQPGRSKTSIAVDTPNVVDMDISNWHSSDEESVIAAATANFGHFGPAAVQLGINWGLRRRQQYFNCRCADILDVLIEKNLIDMTNKLTDSDTLQAAKVFGSLFGAGAFATNRSMLGVVSRPTELFKRLLGEWVDRNRGAIGLQERHLLQIIASTVRDLLQTSALPLLDNGDGIVSADVPGWQDDQWIYISGKVLADIGFANKTTVEALVYLLLAQDLLHPGRERGHKFRLPSRVPGRPRAYRVSRDIIQFAEELYE